MRSFREIASISVGIVSGLLAYAIFRNYLYSIGKSPGFVGLVCVLPAFLVGVLINVTLDKFLKVDAEDKVSGVSND